MILSGPRLCEVSTLRLVCHVRFRVLWGLYPVLLGVVWGAAALLLAWFATIQALVLLEGQQVGLLLLQLSLELLGLALLLELPPFILLSAGRVELNHKQQEKDGGCFHSSDSFHTLVAISDRILDPQTFRPTTSVELFHLILKREPH